MTAVGAAGLLVPCPQGGRCDIAGTISNEKVPPPSSTSTRRAAPPERRDFLWRGGQVCSQHVPDLPAACSAPYLPVGTHQSRGRPDLRPDFFSPAVVSAGYGEDPAALEDLAFTSGCGIGSVQSHNQLRRFAPGTRKTYLSPRVFAVSHRAQGPPTVVGELWPLVAQAPN